MAAFVFFDLQNCFLLLLLSLFLFRVFFYKPKSSLLRLPPSPQALPIIGHLHHLLSTPSFKSLQKLSSKHGPLIYLRVFNSRLLLVSSPSVAYDVYKTNDVNFSSRYSYDLVEDTLVFGPNGFLTASYGEYWRFMKKLVVSQLLGQQHLERSRGLRGEELERFYVNLVDKAKRNEAVDVGKEMMKLANNSICRMAMGTRCSEEDNEAEKIKHLVEETFVFAKKAFIGVALRSLKKFGIPLFEKEMSDISRRYDELLEKILREHEENPNRDHKDMMDVVLEAYHDKNAEYNITRNQMKAFFMELFAAGTDTSSQATKWIMAELINHPNIFKKLRDEIDSVVGKNRLLHETDLPNLPYLQAVVKEGLRLHPPASIMLRKSDESCKVKGFDVPKGTILVINFYAIMRDPDSWENPLEFCPERFLVPSSKAQEGDKEGQQVVKYVPFGGGRRACPGANLAYIMMEMAIGRMVHCFDWKIEGEKVNMEEAGDLVLSMAHPFNCFPVLRFDPLATRGEHNNRNIQTDPKSDCIRTENVDIRSKRIGCAY